MNTDPLADLRGLHLPPEPGLWPLAPGWWLLMAALIVVGLGGVWLWRRHARNHLAHAALVEAARLQVRAQSLNDHDLIAQCSALLRRVAVQQHGPQVAGLAGAAWTHYLASQAPQDSPSDTWAVLGEARYARTAQISSREQLIEACQAWVAHAIKPEQARARA